MPYARFPPGAAPPFDPSPLNQAAMDRISARYEDPETATVAPYIDIAHYEAVYPDIPAGGQDPVLHWHAAGWRERRAPNTWFDTAYYLDSNDDIRAADIDPLLHYVTHGAAEGRQPRPPGGLLRAVIDRAQSPQSRIRGYDAPDDAEKLDATTVQALVETACQGMRGLVLSISHDRYVDITGGVQIFIADEQMLFNGDRFAYIHLSPAVARLTLADPSDAPIWLQLIIDGRFQGLVSPQGILPALAKLSVPTRLFVVHSLFGHNAADLAALAETLNGKNFFWLHDYASICEGYNLLRNDAVFCHAPPEASTACRICVYGANRPAYRETLRTLFATVNFHVLAPSQAALSLWQRAADLPHRSARVHANGRFVPAPPAPPEQALKHPVRIAFVGYPMPHKGWPLFLDLVRQTRHLGIYNFFHFAAADSLQPMDGLTAIPAQVDRYDRFAMIAALKQQRIDLVVALSPWPETFSYVFHEALAAGADIIALADSGNVADAIQRHQRGVVLRDPEALLTFFANLHAVAYARNRARAGIAGGVLQVCGTTATVDLDTENGPDPARFETIDPDLHLFAGGHLLRPTIEEARFLFVLPPDTETVRLISRHLIPGIVRPNFTQRGAPDFRRLGIAVSELRLDGNPVPPGDSRRLSGWHGVSQHPKESWEWTSGDASIATNGATRLEVTLDRLLTYIRVPLAAAPQDAPQDAPRDAMRDAMREGA